MAEKKQRERKKCPFAIQTMVTHDGENKDLLWKDYETDEELESTAACEQFIRKNAADFADKTVRIIQIRNEITVKTEMKPVVSFD